MSERYATVKYNSLYGTWAILDCREDKFIEHEQMNKFGSWEESVWQFNHFESAQYHTDIMNAKEDDVPEVG